MTDELEPNDRIGGSAEGKLQGGTQWFPDATTLIYRADAVSAALNRLRNAVQGRGATPKGPAELAARVSAAQESWRAARAQFFDGSNVLREAYETADALERWETVVNELADLAIAAGLAGANVKLSVTRTLGPGEALERAGAAVAEGAQRTLTALTWLGIGLVVAFLWGRR